MHDSEVPYEERYKKGSTVRIVSRASLEEFRKTWKYHHKLQPEQLNFAGRLGVVESVGYYHGGDVLYHLQDIPGIWHESCLEPGA